MIIGHDMKDTCEKILKPTVSRFVSQRYKILSSK